MEDKIKEKIAGEAKLTEVPVQMAEAFQLEDGKIVTANELLLIIYKEVRSLKKILG
jgi:hypothetical protein